jgi:hypothetical protein
MSQVVKVFWKTVQERRRIYIDYDCWLADTEQLIDFQTLISPYTDAAPLLIDTSYPDTGHRKLMSFASGGVANTSYVVQMIVRTDAGQVKRSDIGFKVLP